MKPPAHTDSNEYTVPAAGARRRVALASLILTATIAAMALLMWLIEPSGLTGVSRSRLLMAPSTAVLLLLLVSGAFPGLLWPQSRITGRAQAFTSTAVLAVSALLLARVNLNFDLPIESWLTSVVGSTQVSKPLLATPLVNVLLMAASLTALLHGPGASRPRPLRQAAALLALAITLIGLLVETSIALNRPTVYGGSQAALFELTAITFMSYGLGWLLLGANDIWPMRLFTSPDDDTLRAKPLAGGFLALATLLTILIVTSSQFYYQLQQAQIHKASVASLESVVDFKAAQIGSWFGERQVDADRILKDRQLIGSFAQLLNNPVDMPTKTVVLQWMESFRSSLHASQGSASLALLNAEGRVILALPETPSPHNPGHAPEFLEALRTRTITVFEPLLKSGEPSIQLSFLVPIANADLPSASGVLQIQIDPRESWFPMLQGWPTPSDSAETLLTRVDGDEVVYLSELRHHDSHEWLRLPASGHTQLPTVQAKSGRHGVFEANDYRGVAVVATARKIAGIPWYLIAKMDEQEFSAGLRQHRRESVLMVVLLLGLALMALAWQWRQQHLRGIRQSLRNRQRMAAVVQDSESRHQHLLEQMHVGLVVLGPDMRVRWHNPMAACALGFSAAELSGKHAADPDWIMVDDSGVPLPPENHPAMHVLLTLKPITGQVVGVEGRHGDSRVWLLIDAYPDLDEQQTLLQVVLTFQDITASKNAQDALRDIAAASLSAEGMPALYAKLHQIVASLLPAENLFVALLDEQTQTISHPYWVDQIDPRPGTEPLSTGLTGRVLQSGHSLLVGGERAQESRIPGQSAVGTCAQSWLGVPLNTGSRTIGAIVVQDYSGQVHYSEAHRELLELLSHPIAAAIERQLGETARRAHAEELSQRNNELSRFNRAAVHRELRMIELKQQINALSVRLGEQPPYALHEPPLPASEGGHTS